MNFGFTEEQELLRKTARAVIEEHAPVAEARRVLEQGASHSTNLWRRLAELGWAGLGVPEVYGGAGLSWVELCILCEELGRTLAPVPFLPHALATAAMVEFASEAQRSVWLPRMASGDLLATIDLHAADVEPALRAEARAGRLRLHGALPLVPDAASAQLVMARVLLHDETHFVAIPTSTPGIETRRLQALDALRPLYEVDCDGVEFSADARLGERAPSASAQRALVDRALVLIAAEMLGGAEKCLESAVAYAQQRVQFGKPIGVHQAIKHKCADMLFGVEAARSITGYAAWAARERHPEAGLLASMAKATAGDAFRRAASDNLQIHGGVGFTWEYDCHLFLRRARSDDAWLGSSSFQRERIARVLGFEGGAGPRLHSE
ncbi:MAG TPA: acyl-CoA dehydrogenase family protein [Myxococcota bacterium]|nr:acyl-CoA dehydrogenase family protein [Myxococcota bacterium]